MSPAEELIQGSEAWHAIRLGRVTASRVADIVARTKTGYGASRGNYLAELVAERLTGAPSERFVNDAMRWGTEKEADARLAYEFAHEVEVRLVGFVHHPSLPMCGASPDGLVGDDGLTEFKCPNTASHIETLMGQSVPSRYVTQMQWQMACTGRAWCDFGSFDPRLPARMQIFVKRIHRDDALIAELEREVAEFLSELESKVARLTALYGQREEAA